MSEGNARLEGLNECEELSIFKIIMKSKIARWMGTIEAEYFVSLERDFLNKYWNKKIQRKVINHILDGRYDYYTKHRNWKPISTDRQHYQKV